MLQIWHGIISQLNCLDNIIHHMILFLETNPSEFIIMRLENYVDDTSGMHHIVLMVLQYSLFCKATVFFSTENGREIIQVVLQKRGKINIKSKEFHKI